MGSLDLIEAIERKRDGSSHPDGEIRCLVDAFVDGGLAEYQMAAWLMAVCIRGLDGRETAELTDAMARSGRMLDFSAIPGTVLDKHSTGGVGDTTTLVVAPLVASCGVPVAKMSGRGLGFTGGTLDKLESIPGFTVDLAVERFMEQVARVGVAVIAQSAEVAPADRRMYALRDVTGTVPSVPLIVASIMSKKIAGGADGILLDVKTGSGALMRSEEASRALASELLRVGRLLGRRVDALMTDMDEPLGGAVGNALEVAEAIRVLRGCGSPRLREVCLALAARMLRLAGIPDGRALAERRLADGSALSTFERWIEAQGGDPRVAEEPGRLPRCALRHVVTASADGVVTSLDASEVGRAAMLLGAGRAHAGDAIDPGAGVELHVRVGERLSAGEAVATLHTSRPGAIGPAAARVTRALALGTEPPAPRPLVSEV